jgi:hypothetical protein
LDDRLQASGIREWYTMAEARIALGDEGERPQFQQVVRG